MWCPVIRRLSQYIVAISSILLFPYEGALNFAQAEEQQVFRGEYVILPPKNVSADTRASNQTRVELVSLTSDSTGEDRIVPLDSEQVQLDCQALLAGYPKGSICEANALWEVTVTPNDERYSDLYGLRNMALPSAWEVSKGSKNVLVAVLDTGVDHSHPDLADNMWVNSGEIPGDGIDNDNNGYVDDIHGYDFYNNDGDPMDDHKHGTHVAGTIGASGNNSLGVVGVNWNVEIMGLKFLGAGGGGSTFAAATAIDYAIEKDVDILNGSFGGFFKSTILEDAIRRAGEAGILFVAAAGNNGSNNDSRGHYPSNFDLDNVVSVAATDEDDKLAFFSNYGKTQVDVAAPGVSILSTVLSEGYGSLSGTSMAAPHVAGLAALILAQNPSFSPEQVISLMINTSDAVSGLSNKVVAGGRVNAARALDPNFVPPPSQGGSSSVGEFGEVKLRGLNSKALVKRKRWQATLFSTDATVADANLVLHGRGGSQLVCSLGSFEATTEVTLTGILPNTTARRAQLTYRDASITKRIRPSKRRQSRNKRNRRLKSLQSSCTKIVASLSIQ